MISGEQVVDSRPVNSGWDEQRHEILNDSYGQDQHWSNQHDRPRTGSRRRDTGSGANRKRLTGQSFNNHQSDGSKERTGSVGQKREGKKRDSSAIKKTQIEVLDHETPIEEYQQLFY